MAAIVMLVLLIPIAFDSIIDGYCELAFNVIQEVTMTMTTATDCAAIIDAARGSNDCKIPRPVHR